MRGYILFASGIVVKVEFLYSAIQVESVLCTILFARKLEESF